MAAFTSNSMPIWSISAVVFTGSSDTSEALGPPLLASQFGWGGAFGTYFWVDRKEQLVGLLMVQEPVGQLRLDLENAVMQAIVE